ncbi:MAG: OmpP1/FadL family transporter [Bdellovibrionota bacterium]
MRFPSNFKGLVLSLLVSGLWTWQLEAQSISSSLGGISASPTRASASGLPWNPASLGFIDGTQIEGNINLIGGWLNYDRAGVNPNTGQTYDASLTKVISPTGFFSLGTDFGTRNFRFGYATYFPSGSMVNYPEQGSQRYDIISGIFVPWHHQFSFAYTPSENWAFAISGIYSVGFLSAKLDVDLGSTLSQLFGESTDIPKESEVLSSRATIPMKTAHTGTVAFGLLYRPNIKWSLGASFYLPTSYWFNQKLELQMPSLISAMTAAPKSLGLTQPLNNQARIHSQLPAYLNLGVRYQAYGYWMGEYFGRYTFGSKNQFNSIYIDSSPIEKLEGTEIRGPKGQDSFLIGSLQTFMFWPSFHFGILGSFAKNEVADQHVSTSRIDFDAIMLGLFMKYRFRSGLRLGLEYAHSFLFDRNIQTAASPVTESFNFFQKPDAAGLYQASIDRVGVSLSYDF